MTPSEILADSKPLSWLDINQDYDSLWRKGALVASPDGKIVARPGPVLSNGPYYYRIIYKVDPAGGFTPIDGRHVAIFILAGPGAGSIGYIPQAEYRGSWREIGSDAVRDFLISSPSVPLPAALSEAALVETIVAAFKRAEAAKDESTRNLDLARGFLNDKNSGAQALIQKAGVELQLLEAFGEISSKDADRLWTQVIRPAMDAADKAYDAISANNASWLTAAWNRFVQIAQGAAIAMKGMGDERLQKIAALYVTLVRHNQAEQRLLDTLGPKDPLYPKIRASLDKTLVAQARIEAKFQEVGIPTGTIRQQAGLGFLVLPAIGAFLATEITLVVVLNVLRWVLTQVIIGIVIDAILDSIAAKINDAALREVEEAVRVPGTTAQSRVSERAKLISDSVVENLKALRDLGAGDPAIEAKVNALEKHPKSEVAVKVTLVALALGFFAWLKYQQYRKVISGRRLRRKVKA